MYHTMMRNADGSWSVGRGYERGQKLRAIRAAQDDARIRGRKTRVVEYRAGGHPLGDVIANFGEDGMVVTYVPDGGGPMRDTVSERAADKRTLERTIEGLQDLLPAANVDVATTTHEMDVAVAVLDDARDRLHDAELESTHADCLHSEAFARYEALCVAIATLRVQHAGL